MNNINMGGMPAMGGPVGGGGIPAMNNGAGPGVRQPMPVNDNRSQLNTYIYEYFLRNEMYDCARSLLQSEQPMSLVKDSPGRRREGDGNGTGDDGGDGDSKDDIDSKRPVDLPAPNLPKDTPESCFLYEWWCLFWDMFNATRGKAEGRNVLQYVAHTQAASRLRQEQQQNMLRGLRGEMNPQNYQNMMMRNQAASAMNNELRQKAFQNQRNAPQNMQMAQKQQQMQRDPSNQDGQQRPRSPGSAENAPSPSKRPRLDGANFNPQQQMPNGRGQGMPQQVGDSGPSNVQAAHMQLPNGIEPNNLTGQQFQNIPGGNPASQARSLGAYQANLAQQQQSQMPGAKGPMPNAGGPPNQGSPMMGAGRDGPGIADYYNPGEMGPNGIRGPAGQPGQPGGNHALQDYQMQLMLLEQQNKKRLMMARQEQDNMVIPRPDGSQGPVPQMGANGQPFQGTSPQGPRSVNSPNPGDQLKRNPNMPGGIPSPLPEGQSRGSPSGMGFNMPGGPMDPNMNPQYFSKMNGLDPNMVGGGMPNGMRPPSSHPGNGFNGNPQMTPQQMAMVRAQQAAQQQQQQQQGNWQAPNGQMVQQPQGAPQQNIGTPQQRAMPPPSAPAPAATNGRTQPSSPQQGAAPPTPQANNKPNPKKKTETKDSKAKRAASKKGSAPNINAGATPSADTDAAGATPTPQTPITPVHNFKSQNGAVQPPANGQPPAQANVAPQQPDMFPGNLNFDGFAFDSQSLEFSNNPSGTDVLQDFDFDSFLHQDGDVGGEPFNFDTSGLEFGDGIGAE